MRKRFISNCAVFLLGIISSWLIAGNWYPGTVSEASCPTLQPQVQGWLKNSSVSYQAIGFTSQEKNQINGSGALGNWNFHNFPPGGNCSLVEFREDPPHGLYTITTGSQNPMNPDDAAGTLMDTGIVTEATTTFYWNASKSGIPAWNRNGSAAYYNAIRKMMLHEAGHTMGLDHPSSEIAQQSVMNNMHGTNDSSKRLVLVGSRCSKQRTYGVDFGFIHTWIL